MMTFFTIFLVLIGINVAMMLVSMKSIGKKTNKPAQNISDKPASVIYPLDLATSNYKKAV
ncbi:hypothetical protein [Maribacter sp. 2210JD10-5]|uniref:hypothetical protein n=1 Tax=Maribacter sp. 2210JD10-5 TaxID=3386272 RepID=UPI0039BCD14C